MMGDVKPPAGAAPPSFDFDKYGTAHVPEDKDQPLVQTPYGRGMVIRTRKSKSNPSKVTMREVELLDWNRSTSAHGDSDDTGSANPHRRGPVRPSTLYTPLELPSVPPQVGDEVVCAYGRGTVLECRGGEGDNCDSIASVVVLLSSWRLARRSRVICFLSVSSVSVVRAKRLYEMSVYERVELAQRLKVQANERHAHGDVKAALQLYERAIDAVRYVQHRAGDDSNNEVRADLVAVLIACHNNAATCGSQLRASPDAWENVVKRHARSAAILIEALEEKKGLKVHSVLRRDGISDDKLFGEWKAKSLVLQATACLEGRRAEYQEAAKLLLQARHAVASFEPSPGLQAWDKKAVKLLLRCKEGRKRERQRERQQALKMFASSDDGEEKKEKSTPETSPRTSPVQSGPTEPAHSTAAPTNGFTDKPASSPTGSAAASTTSSNAGARLRLAQLSPNQTKKRVSFSEHVSEKLYQPEPTESDSFALHRSGDPAAGSSPRRLAVVALPRLDGAFSWLQPPTVAWSMAGVTLGMLLTVAGLQLALAPLGGSGQPGASSTNSR